MARKHRFHSAALEYTFRRYVGEDPRQLADFEEALAEDEIAFRIFKLRTKAGLTQAALAKRVGTTASVISRLEDADYEGHSLAMIRRVAAALGKRVEIRFVPDKEKRATKARHPANRKRAPKSRRPAKENGGRRRRAA
ncbi:MAG: XRE family transcriptional regulator [Candidatus Eisenbacteria bacterium]|nr:XRE family transcriptional regulator [Candidatus Eisenbacteria bacterium]